MSQNQAVIGACPGARCEREEAASCRRGRVKDEWNRVAREERTWQIFAASQTQPWELLQKGHVPTLDPGSFAPSPSNDYFQSNARSNCKFLFLFSFLPFSHRCTGIPLACKHEWCFFPSIPRFGAHRSLSHLVRHLLFFFSFSRECSPSLLASLIGARGPLSLANASGVFFPRILESAPAVPQPVPFLFFSFFAVTFLSLSGALGPPLAYKREGGGGGCPLSTYPLRTSAHERKAPPWPAGSFSFFFFFTH